VVLQPRVKTSENALSYVQFSPRREFAKSVAAQALRIVD